MIVIAQDQNLDDENKLTSSVGILGQMMNVASAFAEFEEDHPDISQVLEIDKHTQGQIATDHTLIGLGDAVK